jgi:hypothetical protein
MTNKEPGYVYILTNPSFREDWVKIGMTQNMEERLRTLDTTALPLPFKKYATLKTAKYQIAEKHVHHYIERFTNLRIRDNREFFNVKPEDALAIFREVAELLDDAEIEVFDESAPKPKVKKQKHAPEPLTVSEPVNNSVGQTSDDFTPRYSSLTTLKSYFRSLNGDIIQKTMQSLGMNDHVSEITDVKRLQRLNESIKAYEKEFNIHHTYSCAVSKYIDYLEHGFTYQDFEHDAMLVKGGSSSKPKTAKGKPSKNTATGVIRPPFDFSMVGLVKGDRVVFDALNVEVNVEGGNTVSYNGRTYSLTGFCKAFLPSSMRNSSEAYQGPKYFSYEGKTLWKIRLEREKNKEF